MKKTFKKLLLGIGISLFIFSCGTLKTQKRVDYPLSSSMKITCNIDNGKYYQIDSIVNADTLPSVNKWLQSTFTDYETNQKYEKRLYVKTYNNGTEVVYIILGNKEPYKITKRITER